MMSTDPEAVYWLTLIYESGLKLNLVKPIIQQWCVTEKHPLAELFNRSAYEWSTMFGLPDSEADRAAAAADKLARQRARLAQWQAQGIEPLIRTDPRYPKRLAQALSPQTQPLIIWARGNSSLFNEPGVTMLGNKEPDEATNRFIAELVKSLVAEGIGLISGYGRGLDRATSEAMLAMEGGHVVTVLPMGLGAFAKTTTRLDKPVEAGQVTLVSPFTPDTAYQERLAEARNVLIDHMALALLIPQADTDTQPRATAALGRGLPIFVGLTDTPHNRTLIDQGALLLTDAGEVVEVVQQAMIDAILQEPADAAAGPPVPVVSPSPAPPAPPAPPLLDPTSDYALRLDDVEPIDSDEALEILSLGGRVPEVLRERLDKDKKK